MNPKSSTLRPIRLSNKRLVTRRGMETDYQRDTEGDELGFARKRETRLDQRGDTRIKETMPCTDLLHRGEVIGKSTLTEQISVPGTRSKIQLKLNQPSVVTSAFSLTLQYFYLALIASINVFVLYATHYSRLLVVRKINIQIPYFYSYRS